MALNQWLTQQIGPFLRHHRLATQCPQLQAFAAEIEADLVDPSEAEFLICACPSVSKLDDCLSRLPPSGLALVLTPQLEATERQLRRLFLFYRAAVWRFDPQGGGILAVWSPPPYVERPQIRHDLRAPERIIVKYFSRSLEGKKLLDYGAGDTLSGTALAQVLRMTYTGYEPYLPADPARCRLDVLEPKTYDLILARYVFHHVSALETVVHNIRSHLARGGYFILVEQDVGSFPLGTLASRTDYLYDLHQEGAEGTWIPEDLEETISKGDLPELKLQPSYHPRNYWSLKTGMTSVFYAQADSLSGSYVEIFTA